MKPINLLTKVLAVVLFFAGLIYIIWPGPTKISDIPALPNSKKSQEPGDTYQNPNNSAYFSEYYRKFVTNFYKNNFEKLNNFAGLIPAIRLNHPPEEAFGYIRDQQNATYLEEYVYPMRDSIFVNGYEPYNEHGKPFYKGITKILVDAKYFNTKTTLRLYHSEVPSRIIVYLLLWATFIALLKTGKKAFTTK